MYTIQPTRLLQYLTWKRQQLPKTYNRTFFTSWEDALWEILRQKQILTGTVLVPDFFCLDVIENMRAHGLQCEYYQLDKNLQPVTTDFLEQLKKYQPHIVVLFHAVGIQNNLLTSFTSWQKFLPKNTLLVEDCVHRVLSLSNVKVLHSNHIVIDSLRKVVPLMGAQCITHRSLALQPTPPTTTDSLYRVRLLWLWILFQLYLSLASYSKSWKTAAYWNTQAEAAMSKGYDLIGDNYTGVAGLAIFAWLSQYLAVDRIAAAKTWQVAVYESQLTDTLQQGWIRTISPTEPGSLRGYPLIVNNTAAKTFLATLRKKGLLVRYELAGCPWSNRQKILYLPLGPHLNSKDILSICKIIQRATKVSAVPTLPARPVRPMR